MLVYLNTFCYRDCAISPEVVPAEIKRFKRLVMTERLTE